ncbi:molybdate ABC transporter substrate-binding protein [Nocardia higoensis]|uniref:Molybdate ABC transporter substrate-binding protein n=1 Tax=Nocardia higoensis TaxID=228599 RepID=A0ABS0D8B5_9NOCA|nr:molybdate ABC transporter substrate-binding protein [Nocardia higoensis]MBF6353882.1 molybdate ABC transporter substrate-binding protein [Nocardia higoensis]
MTKVRGARLVTAVVLAGAVLVGCGSEAGTESGAGSAVSGAVTVFAAASLTEVFTELGQRFEAANPGVDVVFSFAGSSALAQQIAAGAPADVFASAAEKNMRQVRDGGQVTAEPVVFVRNRLEIAVPSGNPGDVTGLPDFAEPDKKIALCAEQVPCGVAAAKVFEAAGITPSPDTREQDVKAALTKVTLGEVDAALVYRTDVLSAAEKVDGIDFPESAAAVNDYPITPLADAPNPATAAAFVDFVTSEQAEPVFTAAGFDLP